MTKNNTPEETESFVKAVKSRAQQKTRNSWFAQIQLDNNSFKFNSSPVGSSSLARIKSELSTSRGWLAR
jgi:hypothetical protein